jgi:hypothetical protein
LRKKRSPFLARAKKVSTRHPALCFGPKTGAAAIALGLQTAIEVAMVAGSNNQGDVTWLISAPSRSWATASSRAKSSP